MSHASIGLGNLQSNPSMDRMLQALIAESSTPDQHRYRSIARLIEQGADHEQIRKQLPPEAMTTLHAVAASHRNNLRPAILDARYGGLRRRLRRRLMAVAILSGIYLVAALLAGSFLLASIAPIVSELTDVWSWYSNDMIGSQWLVTLSFLYLLLAGVVAVAWVTLVIRLCGRGNRPIEAMWSYVPTLGPAMESIDVAQLAHAMHMCVEREMPYSDALDSAAASLRNARLRRWALAASEHMRRGGTFAQVTQSLPASSPLLAGLATIVDSAQDADSTKGLWDEVSRRLHDQAARDTILATRIVPIVTILAMAIACFALVVGCVDLIRSLGETNGDLIMALS